MMTPPMENPKNEILDTKLEMRFSIQFSTSLAKIRPRVKRRLTQFVQTQVRLVLHIHNIHHQQVLSNVRQVRPENIHVLERPVHPVHQKQNMHPRSELLWPLLLVEMHLLQKTLNFGDFGHEIQIFNENNVTVFGL